MSRLSLLIGLALTAGLAGVLSLSLSAQEKEAPTKARGQLPPLWRKLGLTDQQVQRIYTIQQKYREQIQVLQGQIKRLQEQERKELQGVLTAEQRQRLEQLLRERAGGGNESGSSEPKKAQQP